MSIRLLPDNLINQISAGEVIERPSSVVRELVDNSVDAGADDITVYLESGGRTLIRVADNGSGIARDEISLAFKRHATSKLSSLTDLNSIDTMGFRGEALPSIASVAKVTLKTFHQKTSQASLIEVSAGEMGGIKDCSLQQGTDIEIRHLFFNTPVRRKFLKEPKTEELKVKNWIIQSSLARPQVRYRLYCDQREVLNIPRRENEFERAQTFFRGTTVPVSFDRNGIKVTGIVAHPAMAQSDANTFILLVNRRLVSDKVILRAVKDGFHSTLKDREFPLGYLSLDMPATLVDVNVHPQKSEVRFRNSQEVYQAVRSAVTEGVRNFKFPVPVDFNSKEHRSITGSLVTSNAINSSLSGFRTPDAPSSISQQGFLGAFAYQGGAALSNEAVGEAQTAYFPNPEEFKFSNLTYLSQIFACYLLCVMQDDFYVVDMHAAHERVNYNIIRNNISRKETSSQQLLVPEEIFLGEIKTNYLMTYAEQLKEFGFIVSKVNDGTVRVEAVPAILTGSSVKELIAELASQHEALFSSHRVSEKIDHVAARIACHASIRSGYQISREGVYGLFNSLDDSELSSACPHGRPIIVKFSKMDVEKWFGRDR